MAKAKAKAKPRATTNLTGSSSVKSEVPAEVYEYLERERRAEAASGSGFKSTLIKFIDRAKSGDDQLANATVSITLRAPIDGSSAKDYMSAGWDNIKLGSVEFVDADGITFYPRGAEIGNPVVFVPWASILYLRLK